MVSLFRALPNVAIPTKRRGTNLNNGAIFGYISDKSNKKNRYSKPDGEVGRNGIDSPFVKLGKTIND